MDANHDEHGLLACVTNTLMYADHDERGHSLDLNATKCGPDQPKARRSSPPTSCLHCLLACVASTLILAERDEHEIHQFSTLDGYQPSLAAWRMRVLLFRLQKQIPSTANLP